MKRHLIGCQSHHQATMLLNWAENKGATVNRQNMTAETPDRKAFYVVLKDWDDTYQLKGSEFDTADISRLTGFCKHLQVRLTQTEQEAMQ